MKFCVERLSLFFPFMEFQVDVINRFINPYVTQMDKV